MTVRGDAVRALGGGNRRLARIFDAPRGVFSAARTAVEQF